MKLNLGSGYRRQDGYVNVDCESACEPDVQTDLEHAAWPWSDGSIDEVRMCHSLEHMGELVVTRRHVITELYRVLKPGGEVDLAIPWHKHPTFWNDPTHVWPITMEQLILFDRRMNQVFREQFSAHTPLAEYWGVDLRIVPNSVQYGLDENWAKKWGADSMPRDELEERIEREWGIVAEVSLRLKKYPLT